MYFTQAFGGTFYVTWLPTYLASRGLTGMTAGILAGLPLILSSAADLLGGVSTDRAVRRLGLRPGRITIGGGALAVAGVFTIAGAFVASPVAAAVLIALGGASSNFLLGAAWGTCVDIGGRRSGAVSAAMNTSGQVGAILSPILGRRGRAELFELERAALSDGRAVPAGCALLAVGRSHQTGVRVKNQRRRRSERLNTEKRRNGDSAEARFDGRREATRRDGRDRENEHPVNPEVFVFAIRSVRARRPAVAGRPVGTVRPPFNLCCSRCSVVKPFPPSPQFPGWRRQ
mgnify:CR=1 FL=1